MSDTTNSGADPWGLPEDSQTPEDSQAPEGQPEPAIPEPPEHVEEPPTQPVDIEIEPIDEASVADSPPEDETPASPPQSESRGPLSQVLAASGLFGGTPVPRASEPAEEATSAPEPADEAASVDVEVLETAEPPTEPPDLSPPTNAAPVGIGATDADLPNEPPPWMVTEPVLPEPPVAPDPAISDEIAELDAGASLEEAAAAFAEIGTDSPIGDNTPAEFTDALSDVDDAVAADTDMESLVAELADIEPGGDEPQIDDITDISFDPASTPTVYRELESLDPEDAVVEIPELDDAIVEFEGISAASDEVPDLLADGPDEVPAVTTDSVDEQVPEIEPTDTPSADAELEEAPSPDAGPEASDRPEWGLLDYGDEPAEPDAPVFGVTFGSPSSDETEETIEGSDDEVQLLDDPQLLEADTPELEIDASAASADLEDAVDEALISTELEIEEVAPSIDTSFESIDDVPSAPVPVDDLQSAGTALDSLSVAESETVPEVAEAEPPPPADTGSETGEPTGSPDEEAALSEPDPESAAGDTAPIEWGSRWQESAQGWVEDDQGRSTWRPIITTSPLLSEWQIDTYLGVVASDVILGAGPIQSEMALGRTAAMRALVDEAMARGAHAIVGVTTTLAPVGTDTVLTATGTAVTLKAQD